MSSSTFQDLLVRSSHILVSRHEFPRQALLLPSESGSSPSSTYVFVNMATISALPADFALVAYDWLQGVTVFSHVQEDGELVPIAFLIYNVESSHASLLSSGFLEAIENLADVLPYPPSKIVLRAEETVAERLSGLCELLWTEITVSWSAPDGKVYAHPHAAYLPPILVCVALSVEICSSTAWSALRTWFNCSDSKREQPIPDKSEISHQLTRIAGPRVVYDPPGGRQVLMAEGLVSIQHPIDRRATKPIGSMKRHTKTWLKGSSAWGDFVSRFDSDTAKSMAQLRPSPTLTRDGHLDDIIIIRYIKLIEEASQKQSAGPRVKGMLPFLNVKLQLGLSPGATMPKSFLLFDYDVLLIPVHIPHARHWVAVAVLIDYRTILGYDSLGSTGNLDWAMKTLQPWLDSLYDVESQRKSWTVRHYIEPTQSNNYDCGIYALMFMRWCSALAPSKLLSKLEVELWNPLWPEKGARSRMLWEFARDQLEPRGDR